MTYLVNPHVTKAIPYDTFLAELLGADAFSARKREEVRQVKRERTDRTTPRGSRR